jgi:hypothetical protein
MYGKDEKCVKILVRKPEMKRPLGRVRRKWEDNIRMDLRKIEWEVVDWIHVVKDRCQWRTVVKMVINLGVR